MKIQFLGATDGQVTGSRTLLTFPNDLKVLVDFGLTQSNGDSFEDIYRWNGREFEFEPSEVDYLILTHAHVDHIGLVPLLVKRGFKGKIIATAPTGDFARIALPDTAKIMENDIKRINKNRPKNKLEPLFSIDEAQGVIDLIRCYNYNKEIKLDDDVTLELKCAGHMLGASMPLFTYKEGRHIRKLLMTGDTSGKSSVHPFLRVADDLGDVDYVVCESTYGNRTHIKNNPVQIFESSIQETCIERGKTLVIPVFSMQRSSEIMWLLREAYINNPKFNRIPIFLDSPMAIKSQDVIDDNREYWGEKWIDRDGEIKSIFDWDVVQYINDYKESQALANGYPKIILSSSGMCNAGRIQQHLVSFVPSKGCKVLFTGYQAEGTLGHKLLNTRHKSIAINRNQVTIRALIEQVSFSSHADKNQLVELLKTSKNNKLKKIFLIHGEEDSRFELKEEITKHLKNVEVIVPKYNDILLAK